MSFNLNNVKDIRPKWGGPPYTKHVAMIEQSSNGKHLWWNKVEGIQDEYFNIHDTRTYGGRIDIVIDSYRADQPLTLYYSTNKTSWSSKSIGADKVNSKYTEVTSIGPGETIYFHATMTGWGHQFEYNYSTITGYHAFTFRKSGTAITYDVPVLELRGNILSLIYGQSYAGKTGLGSPYVNYAFVYMFYGCNAIKTANKLWMNFNPNKGGFRYMFNNCTNLTLPPSTIKGGDDYSNYCMFNGCTKLLTTPEMTGYPSGTQPYYHCFYNCSSLKRVICKFTSTSSKATECADWLYGVPDTGIFQKGSTFAGYPRSASGIPSGWTIVTV